MDYRGILDQAEDLVKARITEFRVATGGYSPATRLICDSDRGKFFLKAGSTPEIAVQIRREISVYRRLDSAFMPEIIAADERAEIPLLIIEDLSDAFWPPPWSNARVNQVSAAIQAIHQIPTELETFMEVRGNPPHSTSTEKSGWSAVEVDPKPFLNLGIADEPWLNESLAILVDAESRCSTEGDALCHWDIRSDNMCITRGGQVKLIDWNLACRSNPDLDLGFWLPSLELEGGPSPESLLPNAPEIAAWVSGFFAARAGLPMIPDAPGVRDIQLRQLHKALPWCVRQLKLRSV